MVFYRRKLPHWLPHDKRLFVTWRLHGSLPAGVCWEKYSVASGRTASIDIPAFPGSDFLKVDSQLDSASHGPVWLKDPRLAGLVEKSLQAGERALMLYTLETYVVMSNHVHILITPRVPLERITRRIKGFTARQANKMLRRAGTRFWQTESFDHWIRDEREFSRMADYIENNPVKAGLVAQAQDWPWSTARR